MKIARGDGGTTRKAVWVVAALAASFGLAQPALAATARTTGRIPTTQSTAQAGYDFPTYIAVPGAVSATVVVPKLDCKATPGASIYAGVGIQSVNSYARLYLGCAAQGVARYFPSLVVAGTTKNYGGDVARVGDTIELAVSQSDSQVTVSVIDLTHKFVATSNGGGSGTSEGVLAGDFPGVSGSTSAAVPDFGTLVFSNALINGYPFASSPGTKVQAFDLYASSPSVLEIKTTFSTGNHESFTTVFEHS